MDLHELIGESQEIIADAIVAEQQDDLGSAYDHLERL